MEQYKNEEYLKKQIMEQSRHLFIYGYNNEHRSKFLRGLEYDYPVIVNSDKPIALYFDTLGIPKIDVDLKDRDKYLINAVSREYLSFAISTKILERSMELDGTILDSRLSRLISIINGNKNGGYGKIKTTLDLLKEIKISRDFYYESYINYAKGLTEEISIEPDDWETYRDVNGQLVEAIHDYGSVELDDSFKKHMKTLIRNF